MAIGQETADLRKKILERHGWTSPALTEIASIPDRKLDDSRMRLLLEYRESLLLRH